MDDNFGRTRIIGFACALITGMLVIMAGKGCADDAIEKNKKLHEAKVTDPNIIYPGQGDYAAVPETAAPGTTAPVMTGIDIFGNVFEVTEPPVTDVFGNVIDPAAPVTTEIQQFETVTDVFGNVVETIPVTQTTAVVTIDPANTTTLSPIDQYNEDLKNNQSGGYYHGQSSNNEEEDNTYKPAPTIPPDFVIEIG